jgi:hypothetical protein
MTAEQAAQRIAELEAALKPFAWLRTVVHPVAANVVMGRDFYSHLVAAEKAMRQATTHGTGITRTTVDGVEQVDLEDYLA